jgi:hypothetical protein
MRPRRRKVGMRRRFPDVLTRERQRGTSSRRKLFPSEIFYVVFCDLGEVVGAIPLGLGSPRQTLGFLVSLAEDDDVVVVVVVVVIVVVTPLPESPPCQSLPHSLPARRAIDDPLPEAGTPTSKLTRQSPQSSHGALPQSSRR